MKYLIIATLLFTACVATQTVLRNPDGTVAPDPESMPEGRQICLNMCRKIGREYQEYRYDGKCVCRQKPKEVTPPTPATPQQM